jgi:magnesium-transporting ATPase (P-type)
MGAFFSTIFAGLFGFLATYFTKKVTYGAAVVTTVLAVTATFYIAIQGLVHTLAYTITDEWLLVGFFSVLPGNAVTCITAMFFAEIAGFIYRHQLYTINAVASAS